MLVCFLDEKWFYTIGRQRRLKHLPRGPHEPEGVDRVKLPRALSRRFPIKVMFMGIVAKPLHEIGFDGGIFLKRITERKVWKKTSYNQNFSDNAIINSEIIGKIGVWREIIHDNTLTFSVLYQQLDNHYKLDYLLSGI